LLITPSLELHHMLLAYCVQTTFTKEGQEIPFNGGSVVAIDPATSTSGQFCSQLGYGLHCGCFEEVSLGRKPESLAITRLIKPLTRGTGGIDPISLARGLTPPTSRQ